MDDAVRAYCAGFVEDSLGLPRGSCDPSEVPDALVAGVASAMGGSPDSASPSPVLEHQLQAFLQRLQAEAVEAQGYFVRKARWPGNASFAACLTHDVDNVRRPLSHILRRAGRFSATDLALAVLGVRSPYDNLDLIAKWESGLGMRSSFYFLSKNYDLGALAPPVKELARSGWEAGLHGDFGTHDSPEAMGAAAARISEAFGSRPAGLREHFLQFDYGKTWGVAESCGFLYDTTVGNRDRLGFRLGLCSPFRPPDQAFAPMKIVELPLVLMDTTLWGYLKRDEAAGERDFLDLLGEVAAVNGLMTVLWHQESVRMKGGRIYPRVLSHIARSRCYSATGEGIARWWLARGAPLAAGGSAVSMEAAPEGLVLTFKSGRRKAVSVEGGFLKSESESQTVTAAGGPLRVSMGAA